MEIQVVEVRNKPLGQRVRIGVTLLVARLLRVPIGIREGALHGVAPDEVSA